MLPLFKIRFIKIKRHLGSNTFTFFLPTILILVLSLGEIKYFKDPPIPPNHINSKMLNIFEKPNISNSSIGIMCEDNDHEACNSFYEYIKADYDVNCTKFTSEQEIRNYVEINETLPLVYIFTIKTKEGILDFDLRFQTNQFKSVYESSNELVINQDIITANTKQFQQCQQIISHYINKTYSQTTKTNVSIYTKPLTRPSIYNTYSLGLFPFILPLCISLGQSSSLFYIMSWMISERENKIDEFTKRQGISKTTYLISWFVTFFLLTLIPVIISCVLLQLFFFHQFFFIWLLFMEELFLLNIFGLAFFIQSLVNKTQTGNLLMKIIILGITLLSIVITKPEVTIFAKVLFCLFPQVTQVFGLSTLLYLDNYETGIDMHLLFTNHNGLSFGIELIILITTFILYIAGALIILTLKLKGNVKETESNTFIQNANVALAQNHQALSEHNVMLKENNELLEIKNLTRFYGDLTAVNGFNGELFKNEIFCLLGHNGAGKTTLIKMISGLEDPDKGDILLNGKSIVVNKEYLFSNLGLCAQEDIFFEYLTVQEHLQYMCEIKGAQIDNKEIDTLLTKLSLKSKMNCECETLSGGQKRKLCIALALIGNSKLILLDEPTSGMDIIAKRELWEFLKNYKDNKIIILTTHSLDEAEYLGDRIGIMSEGSFICSGTSSYLKNKYPCGFNINLIFDSKTFTEERKVKLIEQLKTIDASCKVKISSKFAFTINFSSVVENIEQIFETIDNIKEQYGILNYTISTTTLEDVFLKLNDSNITPTLESTTSINNDEDKSLGLIDVSIPYDLNSFERNFSFCNQLKYGMKRNFLTLWRSVFLFLLEILSSSSIIYVYMVCFYELIIGSNTILQNLNYLLQHNDVYTLTQSKGALSLNESTFYKEMLSHDVNFVSLETYKVTYDMNIDEVEATLYNNHKYKNAQSVIVTKENIDSTPNTIDIYVLYSQSATDFYQSTMNLVMSAYFEKYYNVKVTLGTTYASVPSEFSGLFDIIIYGFRVFCSLFILIAGFFSFSSYILLNPLKERISNIKHLLYLSGSHMGAYWINIYIIEVFKTFCLLIIISPIFLKSQLELLLTYPLIICFILSLVAYCCCWSFLLRKEEQAQSSFFNINLLLFIVTLILTFTKFSSQVFTMKNIVISLIDITPLSSFAYHLFRLVISIMMSDNKTKLYTDSTILFILFNGCAVQIGTALIYMLLLLLFEKRIIGKIWNNVIVCCSLSRNNNYEFSISTEHKKMHKQQKRHQQVPGYQLQQIQQSQLITENRMQQQIIQTVNQPLLNSTQLTNHFAEQEKEKVLSNQTSLTVVISQLRKTFFVCSCSKKNLRAVNDLYLGLEPNEKFGLLGFNGSGKTTTFRAITNEIFFDKGNISLFGINTKADFQSIRKTIGYCPQENALFPQLTVAEVINFYKQLKGITEDTKDICSRFGLHKYLKTKTSHLSGGNKRKLLFAIAMMGKPRLLLLDEPSTGVDPESRRLMWKNINSLSQTKDKYNMILTTHSMEEAEILCDTVSWLKQGNFVCIGNPEKLKMEFSEGYTIHIKFVENNSPPVVDTHIIINNLMQLFPFGDLNHVINNSSFMNHAYCLLDMVSIFKPFCSSIEIIEIGKDLSFKLKVVAMLGKEGQLFSCVLKQKNLKDNVSEINISMQSLEDILTNF